MTGNVLSELRDRIQMHLLSARQDVKVSGGVIDAYVLMFTEDLAFIEAALAAVPSQERCPSVSTLEPRSQPCVLPKGHTGLHTNGAVNASFYWQ